MSNKFPWFAAETGTYSTTAPNPHIDLSGNVVALSGYPARTFAAAAADTDTDFNDTDPVVVTIFNAAGAWARYSNVPWNDAAPDTLDLSAATLEASSGTLSNADSVSVLAAMPAATQPGDLATVATTGAYSDLSGTPSIPTIPAVMPQAEAETGTATTQRTITAAVIKAAVLEHAPAWDGDIADIDLDGGTDIGAALADADLILVDDGAGGTNRKSALSRVWTYVTGKISAATALALGGYTEKSATITFAADATLPIDGGVYALTLTGDITGFLTSGTAPSTSTIYIAQDATGSRACPFPSAWNWPDGTAFTAPSTASAVFELTLRTDPSGNIYASAVEMS